MSARPHDASSSKDTQLAHRSSRNIVPRPCNMQIIAEPSHRANTSLGRHHRHRETCSLPALPGFRDNDKATPPPVASQQRRPLPYLGALRDLLPQPTTTQQERAREQRQQLLQEWSRQIEAKRAAEAQRRAQEALRDAQEDAAVAAYHAQHAAKDTPRHDHAPPLSAPPNVVARAPQPATLSQLEEQWAQVQQAQQQLAAAAGRRVTAESAAVAEPQSLQELHSESRLLSRTSNRIPRLPRLAGTTRLAPKHDKPVASRRWR